MDDSNGKLIADFINANIENILKITESAYSLIEENFTIKIRTAYTKYLKKTLRKYSKSKSFLLQNQVINLIDYYVPIGIETKDDFGFTTNKIKINNPSSIECFEKSPNSIISGLGGSGKSILLKYLFLDTIQNKKFTPIFIELRDINEKKISLLSHIKKVLEINDFDVSGQYVEKAFKSGHFALFLDGFDELINDLKNDILFDIKDLSNRYDKCPIYITTRPDNSFSDFHNFNIFNIQPLSMIKATELVNKLPFDPKLKIEFINELERELYDTHQTFLSNPLLLSIMLLTFRKSANIPSKLSIFYNQAYEALYQTHDAYKGAFQREKQTELDIVDFSKVFSLFSLLTYDKSVISMSLQSCLEYIQTCKERIGHEFIPNKFLEDLMSSICLMVEDGLEITYTHRSFQEYFVALYIKDADSKIQKYLIEKYWDRIGSDSVIKLLLELKPSIVEEYLFLPYISSFFNEIKINDQINDESLLFFYKKYFVQFDFNQEGISAQHRNKELTKYIDLIRIFNNYKEPYKFPHKKHRKSLARSCLRLGFDNALEGESLTNDLKASNPVFQEIVNSGNFFSIQFFKHLNNKLLEIRRSHESFSDDLISILEL